MEAFYFGPSSTYLFGAYHPPKLSNRREGIVLCSPFGQENMRAHRSLRRLAINLSNLGYAVLRFDYRGTGDSAGSLNSVTADDWQQDIRIAVQELIDIAAVPKVSLLGLRIGALLAAQVAANHQNVSRLVMWDPVVSGQAYIDELTAEIRAAQSRANFIATDRTLHFNGFSMPLTFQQSLANLDIRQLSGLQNTAVAQIVSHENQRFTDLYASLNTLPRFVYELAPAPHDWNYVDHVGGILWPQPIVQAIENYFSAPQL
ncbi:MAG: alpha/beta fold hydrolase [Gammaproteobacteria bacterium]|nr:MAG: alpha/beta fold hydrolase [Gammaproteobacteria bacterium]